MPTIRKNATKKISALLATATTITVHTLDNQFAGRPVEAQHVMASLKDSNRVYTTTRSKHHKSHPGANELIVSIHSNCWFSAILDSTHYQPIPP